MLVHIILLVHISLSQFLMVEVVSNLLTNISGMLYQPHHSLYLEGNEQEGEDEYYGVEGEIGSHSQTQGR